MRAYYPKFSKSLKYEKNIERGNVIKSGERGLFVIKTGRNLSDRAFPRNQQGPCWQSIFNCVMGILAKL